MSLSTQNASKPSIVIRMRDNQSSYFNGKEQEEKKHGRVIELPPDGEDKKYVAKKDSTYGFEDETLDGDPEKIWRLLEKYDGKTLSELKKEESGIQVLGLTPDETKDRNRINNEKVYPFYLIKEVEEGKGDRNHPESFRLETSNLMGVLSLRDADGFSLSLQVESRFDKNPKQPFLLYILEKVFDFDLAEHQAADDGNNSWLSEILLYLSFRNALMKAAEVGLYKKYERVRYNDLRFRGRLDLARHLRLNFPVMDRIAYVRREITFDHCVNHLIRSAADELEKKIGSKFVERHSRKTGNEGQMIGDFLRDLQTNTPKWQRGMAAVRRYLEQRDALEPVTHTYFAEVYEDLRILSRMILEKETGSPYSGNDGYVSGILFDGAWLWEEYLAKVFEEMVIEKTCEFVHSIPLTDQGRVRVFHDYENSRYPDFRWDKDKKTCLVLDAKYRRNPSEWAKGEKMMPEDCTEQLFTYLLLTGARTVGLVYPPHDRENTESDDKEYIDKEYTINQLINPDTLYTWYSFTFGKIGDQNDDYKEMRKYMEEQEEKLKEHVRKILKKS